MEEAKATATAEEEAAEGAEGSPDTVIAAAMVVETATAVANVWMVEQVARVAAAWTVAFHRGEPMV